MPPSPAALPCTHARSCACVCGRARVCKSCLSLTSCCLSDTVRGQREKCTCCTSTQVHVCSLQVRFADMEVSCLDWMVEEEERISEIQSNPAKAPSTSKLGFCSLSATFLPWGRTEVARRPRSAQRPFSRVFFLRVGRLRVAKSLLQVFGGDRNSSGGKQKKSRPKNKKRKEKGVKVF